MHRAEQCGEQVAISVFLGHEPELRPRAGQIVAVEPLGKRGEHAPHRFQRLVFASTHDRQQALGQPRKVPVGDPRLVGVGVAALLVDRTEDGGGIVGVEKSARAVVDRLPRHRHVVGVHDAVHEAHQHPAGHERRLPLDDPREERDRWIGRLRGRRIVSRDRVVEQRGEQAVVLHGRRELKRAHPDVARGHASEYSTGQRSVSQHEFAGRGHGEAPGRGNAEGMHAFAHDVFAEHRPDRGAAVAAAGVAGAARALELNVVPPAVRPDLLTEQNGPAVAEVRKVTELVAGIGLRDRLGPGRDFVAGKDAGSMIAQDRRIEAKLGGQRLVHDHDRR